MIEWDISFLNKAWFLGRNNFIQFEEVPEVLQADLKNFMFGKTVTNNEHGIVIYKNDYLAWLNKIRLNGFDYDIQLKKKNAVKYTYQNRPFSKMGRRLCKSFR